MLLDGRGASYAPCGAPSSDGDGGARGVGDARVHGATAAPRPLACWPRSARTRHQPEGHRKRCFGNWQEQKRKNLKIAVLASSPILPATAASVWPHDASPRRQKRLAPP